MSGAQEQQGGEESSKVPEAQTPLPLDYIAQFSVAAKKEKIPVFEAAELFDR